MNAHVSRALTAKLPSGFLFSSICGHCFERAIAVAREQESRWWELRARTTLVEWLRAHGKRVDRAEFAPFVRSFTEGDATVDVRAARRAASA